jgi:SAM-dependent methyltransferase
VNESAEIRRRYERRKALGFDARYNPQLPSVYMAFRELEWALIRWIRVCKQAPVKEKRVLEIGCGSGGNLLEFIRLGFRPQNLVANELLEDRAASARRRLPQEVEVLLGDALELRLPENSFDIVLQSTVFTSILADSVQAKLANLMWQWTKPGGGILWYDFVYNNPENPDVRGVPVRKIRRLFPHGRLRVWPVTLAPPLSRLVVKIHPFFYTILNSIHCLRTHVLCWVAKN